MIAMRSIAAGILLLIALSAKAGNHEIIADDLKQIERQASKTHQIALRISEMISPTKEETGWLFKKRKAPKQPATQAEIEKAINTELLPAVDSLCQPLKNATYTPTGWHKSRKCKAFDDLLHAKQVVKKSAQSIKEILQKTQVDEFDRYNISFEVTEIFLRTTDFEDQAHVARTGRYPYNPSDGYYFVSP